MFSFNSVLQSLTPSKIVTGIANNYNKLKDKMVPSLVITEIIPSIFHLDFPQRSNVNQLSQHIGSSEYIIWNISEYPYEDQFPKLLKERNKTGEMHHLNFQYYSNLPFYELIEAILQIEKALKKTNCKVYVHCQEGKVRSAVFLASFLFVTSSLGVQDISEAIHHINKKLGINLESKSNTYKNQHTLFKNLVNYTTNKQFINKNRMELQKLSINNAPKIRLNSVNGSPGERAEWIEVQVVLQIRCGPEVVHKCVYKDLITQGDSISLNLSRSKRKIILGDEFLVIVKYLHKKSLYNVLRIQSNTNFIFNNFARVHGHDIDMSGLCQPQKNLTFIDLTFKEDQSFSKLWKINEKNVKTQQKKSQNWDLLGQGVTDSGLYVPEQQFAWFQQQPEIDEHELNTKIEQVMKNMNKKQEQRDLDKQSEEEQEDFDDYLVKLQSQAQG